MSTESRDGAPGLAQDRVTPSLVHAFQERFGGPPTHRVRAPGRVNLMGEHLDYNGLSVLPMALPLAVHAVFRPRDDDRVRLANLDAAFGDREFRLGPEIAPYEAGDWGNYPKAAAQAMARDFGAGTGVDAVVSSQVPVAAGLSSSSALVIATGLALAASARLQPDRLAMGESMARGERYVGTQGGGMDQAISLGATEGSACRIDFHPLRLTPVPVPASWRFVVAHSLEPAHKSGAARDAYNARTRECGQALERVASALAGGRGAQSATEAGEIESTGYRELLDRWSPSHVLEVGQRVLAGRLRKRFRHVVTESQRVAAAEQALRDGAAETFGRLMRGSHDSLRDDYQVSSPGLDRLVEVAERAGALGARLTGAGFGGCVVALAGPDGPEALTEALRHRYYRPAGVEDPGAHVFGASPSGGASVETLGE